MGNERPVTVEQMLASPAFTGAELVAGETGLQATISEVALHMRLRDDSPPTSGEFVVLDAAGIGDHTYQVDMAIRIIADAGAVSLASRIRASNSEWAFAGSPTASASP